MSSKYNQKLISFDVITNCYLWVWGKLPRNVTLMNFRKFSVDRGDVQFIFRFWELFSNIVKEQKNSTNRKTILFEN